MELGILRFAEVNLTMPVQAQRFLSAMGEIYDHFQMGRHKTTATVYRTLLKRSLDSWRTIAQSPLGA